MEDLRSLNLVLSQPLLTVNRFLHWNEMDSIVYNTVYHYYSAEPINIYTSTLI